MEAGGPVIREYPINGTSAACHGSIQGTCLIECFFYLPYLRVLFGNARLKIIP
jgi:hypothetical protein